ncbi:hypothetical protein C7B70_25255 [Chlorogloea sp. CCALA 695]|nr:hypothetical protein C7B70_25255 [Chlorogloea sp. CCALA 695]
MNPSAVFGLMATTNPGKILFRKGILYSHPIITMQPIRITIVLAVWEQVLRRAFVNIVPICA